MEKSGEVLDEEGAGVPLKKRPIRPFSVPIFTYVGLFLGGTPAPSSSNSSAFSSIGASLFGGRPRPFPVPVFTYLGLAIFSVKTRRYIYELNCPNLLNPLLYWSF